MKEYNDNSLWLSFRLDGMEYCILSDYIEAITIPNAIEPVPDSSSTFAGITTYSDTVLGVVEMREIFGRVNLKTYTEQFSIMKDMHVSWVVDLEQYVHEGGVFTKAVDPHKCKFGLWYDGFHSDNNRLNRLLKKISTPHERIHRCGGEIIAMRAQEGDHEAEILTRLAEARDICYNEIVPLLDRLIDIYRAVNRGVMLVVRHDGNRVGLLVDDVRMLIACNKTTQQAFTAGIQPSRYISKMVINNDNIMLEVNVEKIVTKQLENEKNRMAKADTAFFCSIPFQYMTEIDIMI